MICLKGNNAVIVDIDLLYNIVELIGWLIETNNVDKRLVMCEKPQDFRAWEELKDIYMEVKGHEGQANAKR